MKKYVAILMAAMMLLTAAACGGKTDDTAKDPVDPTTQTDKKDPATTPEDPATTPEDPATTPGEPKADADAKTDDKKADDAAQGELKTDINTTTPAKSVNP